MQTSDNKVDTSDNKVDPGGRMTKRPTSIDIALRAGVSQPTVSRALRGSPKVSQAVRLRVEAVARELGYTVHGHASNLRAQSSRTLALLLFEDPTPDDSAINPFFLAMLGAITRHCALSGYDLLVSFQRLAGDWHLDYEDSGKADGMILLGYGDYEAYRARLEGLVAKSAHFVRWGSVREGQPGLTLGCDNRLGGRLATDHLLDLGRRRIVFMGATHSGAPEFQDRYLGYCEAHRVRGLDPDPALRIDADSTDHQGRSAMLALLDRGYRPDGVVAASDLIAIGALNALAERGVSVPHEVAVTGFDDILSASFTSPPLTTVAQDAKSAGRALVETLIRAIRGEGPTSIILPVRLVVRQSTQA